MQYIVLLFKNGCSSQHCFLLLQQLSIKVELNKETEKSFECELGKQYSITTTGVANDFSKTREAILYKSNKRLYCQHSFHPGNLK